MHRVVRYTVGDPHIAGGSRGDEVDDTHVGSGCCIGIYLALIGVIKRQVTDDEHFACESCMQGPCFAQHVCV